MPIDFESQPLRELRKGRDLAWDPQEIGFGQDRVDWHGLSADERQLILSQIIGFLVGERAVTHDLSPLQRALRGEKGRMEEEMYLAQQLYEEANHVEFFQRWINEVLPGKLGQDVPYPPLSGSVFSRTLPEVMQALDTDRSPAAQMRGVVAYHQLVEGVLAEVGYAIFYACLDERGLLPGLRRGVRLIQQDESRHIAFGTYLARRLIREHPELERVFIDEMERLHDEMVGASDAFFGCYPNGAPFGLDAARFRSLSEDLYQRRMRAVLKGGFVEVE